MSTSPSNGSCPGLHQAPRFLPLLHRMEERGWGEEVCFYRFPLPMNLRFVAVEVTRRIPLGDNSFRLITSAATRFRAARREDGFRGVLSSVLSPLVPRGERME